MDDQAIVRHIRRVLVKWFLAALNSRWINTTPCRYEFVGNLDAFSRENLESEDRQRPGITVRTVLDEASQFKACPVRPVGVTVIEGEEIRDASLWDLHELRQMITKGKQ